MSKRYSLLLALLSIVFILFGVMLCFQSRLATDDYYFIADVRNVGINQSVYSQYMAWCGRFAACYLVDFFYKAFDIRQTWYFIFPLSSFLLLLMGIYSTFKALSFQFQWKVTTLSLLIFTCLFAALLFFLSVDIGETWIWYCSLSSYLWSVIAFIWGLAFLFGNYNKRISLLLSAFCFLYVGGASEVYSVICGVLMLLYLSYQYKQAGSLKAFWAKPLNRSFCFVYLLLGVSFLIFLVAPGNYLRDELFPKHELIKTLFITSKSIVKFGILYLPIRLVYVLAFASPFLLLGKEVRLHHAHFTLTMKAFFWKSTILFASLLLLFFLLVAYVMVETGPPRLWFMVAFLFAVYAASLCFYAGYTSFIVEPKIRLLQGASLLLITIVLFYNCLNQLVITTKYTKANDERIAYLLQLNKTIHNDTIVKLKPLPPAGMLYSSEISEDTSHFTNRELKMGLQLKFHVVVNR